MALELGACKDLKDHIFTISSCNKGKEGDVLCRSNEKMATYIGTKYGDNVAQELTSKKRIMLKEKTYLTAVETRHTESIRAKRERLNEKMTSLAVQHVAMEDKIKLDPTYQEH
jgi:hypothetical protein